MHLKNTGVKRDRTFCNFRTCKTSETRLNIGVQSVHKCTLLYGYLPILILRAIICIKLANGN